MGNKIKKLKSLFKNTNIMHIKIYIIAII